MSTKITYNGKTTELADGYIATLPCKDLKMETDVVVEAPEGAESGGGAELNIAYGDTAPEDTSKLWVKTTQPSKVKVSKSLSYMGGDEAYNTLEAVLPKSFAGVSAGVVGDKIYLFSGYDGYTWGNKTIYCFDTTTKTISTLSATLPNAYTAMGCAVVGKAIYLLGGTKSGNYSSDIVRFDTETETVTLLDAKTPDKNTDPTSVAIGTDIWSLGGEANYCVWKFDTISGTTHTTTASINTSKNFRSSLQADGSNIYIFGGFNVMPNKAMGSISKFDTITETLTTLNTTLPTAKCLMASTKIGSRIYLFGGATNSDNIKSATGTTTVYCFDMETETITTLPITLATGKKGVHSAGTVGETCYIFGGQNTNAIDEFKPNLTVSVAQNNLHLLSAMGNNKFNLINTDTIQAEIGVSKVYKGNADGIGEQVEAALHNGTSWVTI